MPTTIERPHVLRAREPATPDVAPMAIDPLSASQGDLVGRTRELSLLRRVIDDGLRPGREALRALVLTGEAGVGKSSLSSFAVGHARGSGAHVIEVRATRAETDLAFAGLNALLRPFLGRAAHLDPAHRAALSVVFGTRNAGAEPLLMGTAVLELLADVSASRPLLIVVEDAQWLDRPTLETLAFVARRLADEPIVLLATATPGGRSQPELEGLATLHVTCLDEMAAVELLELRSPALPAAQRDLVLTQAGGNPLALIELSAGLRAITALDGRAPAALELPLGGRLLAAFSARLAGLPEAALRLLLVTACEERASLAEVLEASACLGGDSTEALEGIASAADAGLVVLEGPVIRFTHPLLRVAIYQGRSHADRRAAHAALARSVRVDALRRACHVAASIIGPDERAAAGLRLAASSERSEGRLGSAFLAFERSAWLTTEPGSRARSLLEAADAAFELGWSETAVRLVEAARESARGLPEGALVSSAERYLGNDQASGDGAVRDLLDGARVAADPWTARRLVLRAALGTLWISRSAQANRDIADAVVSIEPDRDDPWRIAVLSAVGDDDRRTGIPEDAFEGLLDGPDTALALGFAASVTGDERAGRFLAHAVDGFRSRGRVATLAQALALLAWAEIGASRLEAATCAADEAAALAATTGQSLWQSRALSAGAFVAAMRGDGDAFGSLADAADRTALTLRADAAVADVLSARGHDALAGGRHDEAVRALSRIYEERESIGIASRRLSSIGDYAEAANRAGDLVGARQALAALSRAFPQVLLERRAEYLYACALLADDDEVEPLLVRALEESTQISPFMRARMSLALGSQLRRSRRLVGSRAPLETAATAFEALGMAPWAQRARQELRASGIRSKHGYASRRELTPQETLIAQMAASGLSNQQIGRRLFLSPRTIGAHLYRLFPKLGITSRGELHGALATEDMLSAV